MNIKTLLAAILASASVLTGVAQTVETFLAGQLSEPYDVVVDTSTTNNIHYISDSANDRVARYIPALNELLVTARVFSSPHGLVLSGKRLIVADSGSHRIMELNVSTYSVTVLAGGRQGYAEGAGTNALFSSPSGVAMDAAGNLYIADSGNRVVRKMTPAGVVSTYATGFKWPVALALGEGGRLFVADPLDHSVKAVETDGSVSSMGLYLADEETGAEPRGLLWVGGETGLLVSDAAKHVIRRLYGATSHSVGLYAGAIDARGNVDGALTTARFSEPMGMAVDADGMIVVADMKNNELRRIVRKSSNPPIITPLGWDAALTAPGRFSNDVEVVASSLTTNAIFYYTTDGSEPTVASTPFPTPLKLTGGPVGLKVRAFSPDFGASGSISNSFKFYVNPLTSTTGGDNLSNDVYTAVTTLTRGASVHYTTNGLTPTTNDPVWIDRVYGTSSVVKWKAFRDGFEDSPEFGLDFVFRCDYVVIYPPGPAGPATESDKPLQIHFECGTSNVTYYWTIDDTLPNKSNPTAQFSDGSPFLLETNGILQVRAYKPSYVESSVMSATFNLVVAEPEILPRGATNSDSVLITLTSATPNAKLYYTMDESDPTTNSALYAGPFLLETNGIMKVRGYYKGFSPSFISSAYFGLKVAKPKVTPKSIDANNPVVVNFSSATPKSVFYWTIDGSDPSVFNGNLVTNNPGSITLTNTGNLKLVAVRTGFQDSDVFSGDFNLTTADLVLSPAGAESDNDVAVTFESATTNAVFYWTIDGSVPSRTHGNLVAANPGSLVITNNGTFKIIAVEDFLADSAMVSSDFKLKVGTPVATLTPASDVNINAATIDLSESTTNATVYYTLDGSTPTIAKGTVYTGAFTVTTNASLRAIGIRKGYLASEVLAKEISVQVDAPGMSPNIGYFPNGTQVSLSVVRPDAVVYYTLDGTDPTTNSTRYVGPFSFNGLTGPNKDLQALKARAFAPNTLPSAIVSGQPVPENAVGVPQNMIAGVGSTIVVPVVLNLKSNEVVKSLQYKLLVSPASGSLKTITEMRALTVGTNDFVRIVGSAESGFSTTVRTWNYMESGPTVTTNVMEIAHLTAFDHLLVESYGTVAMLAVSIPTNAVVGDTYALEIAFPSGTSDGEQALVGLTNLPPRFITVSNLTYIVGDSSPGVWYNAGTFGDGELDNADVNNAVYASMGVRVPYPFTDAFDAMDAIPEDIATAVGGDGQIRQMDWERILHRSLRGDLTNWKRSWSASGQRVPASAVLGGLPAFPASSYDNRIVGKLCPLMSAEPSGQVRAGQNVSVPIYVSSSSGQEVTSLQFRAVVNAVGGAPALDAPVSFVQADGLPQPLQFLDLPGGQVARAWTSLLNPFAQPLVDRVRIGEIQFTVPASSVTGQTYTLQLANADGVADGDTMLDFATSGASLTVGSPARAQETARAFKLAWQAPTGRRFVVESSPDLSTWHTEGEVVASRDGRQEYSDVNAAGLVKFYRIRPLN